MIPENEPKPYLTAEEIELKLQKIDELEKKIGYLENWLETLTKSNKVQHEKIWLKLEEGDNDV